MTCIDLFVFGSFPGHMWPAAVNSLHCQKSHVHFSCLLLGICSAYQRKGFIISIAKFWPPRLLSLHLIRVGTFCSKCTAFKWCWVVHPSHWMHASWNHDLVSIENVLHGFSNLLMNLPRPIKFRSRNKHLGSDRLPLKKRSKIRPKNIPNSICSLDASKKDSWLSERVKMLQRNNNVCSKTIYNFVQ